MCNGLSASYFRRRAEEGNLLNYFCSVFAWGERKKVMCQAELKELLVQFYFWFAVPSEFRECGLPQWMVNGHQWTSMRKSGSSETWNLEMTSARRFQMVHNGQLSQMTCKRILQGMNHQDHQVQLVAYQKKGWWVWFFIISLGKSPGRKLLETQISWWTYMQLQGTNAINFLLSYRDSADCKKGP